MTLLRKPSLLLLLVTLIVLGCDRAAPEPQALEAGTSSSRSSTARDAEASEPSPSAAAPRQNETTETPTAQLGTLPEGLGLPVGLPMPDARLRDIKGETVHLSGLVADGPLLLVFYRGGWCPYCNFQIHNLTDAFGEFKSRGVTPVAITVDRFEEAAATKATYTIPFPVLADTELEAHHAFSVLRQADEAEVEKLRGFGIDLEASSGRADHVFAVPAVFLVDKGGVIRWAHADRDYRQRPSTKQLLSVIDTVLGGTP